MANPNPEIWGAPETWDYSPQTTYGLTSALSQTLHADRPKIAHFGGTTPDYTGSLLQAINVAQKMTLNEFIDNTICPCGQDPAVSPFAKIAIFNENDDLSTTPRVVTITDNINWFFADKAATQPLNNDFEFFKQYTRQDVSNEGLKYQQFAPKANSPANTYNVNMGLCPYTYYGLRSLFLSIEVRCIPKTATNPILQTTWRTLKAWQLNYSETEDIIGLRLYVRNCQAINETTHQLTYSTDKAITGGQQSYVCITNPITINNDGTDTPTQLLSIFNKGNRCAYIFDITDQIFAWDSGNDSRTNRAVLPCWDYFDGQTVNTWYADLSDPTRYYYYKIPYSENTYNKIMSIAALFGCFFTDRNVNVFPYDMLSEYAYLPIIDENGVAHGQYTHGAANATNSLYSKNSIREIDYNPDTPPAPVDTNTYNNTTYFNVVAAGASLNKRYLLDGDNVRKLSTDLFTICDTISENQTVWDNFESKVKSEFLTQSPIDSIVSLIRLPFAPSHGTTKQPVKLGRYTASAEGYTISNMIHTITFNGIDIFPKFGNSFLDYEPYTKYELYVPFCGTIQLNAADVIDKTLNCRIIVDLLTGACTAYVMANSLCIETITGNVGAQLPITGLDTATINANIQSAEQNQKAAKWKYFASYLPLPSVQKNNISNIIKNGDTTKRNLEQTHYELTHINTPMHTIGSASPVTGWASDLVLRLLIYYPVGNVIDSTGETPKFNTAALTEFGNLNGFATCETGQLKNYHGFTTVSDADLKGIIATDSELLEIRNLLQSGVYL